MIATNPTKGKAARIQVKSRWKTGAVGFIIRNFESDFVVVALLNRGTKDGSKSALDPEYLVIPTKALRKIAEDTPNDWGRIDFRQIPRLERYRENWALIEKFLRVAGN